MEARERKGDHLVNHMKAEGFIAGRLRFKGRVAVAATAISFFIIILSVCIAEGFSREIRQGAAAIAGDILISDRGGNFFGTSDPVPSAPSFAESVKAVRGVESLTPIICRSGIIRKGDEIRGVLFKGTDADTVRMGARVPSALSSKLGIRVGDELRSWFISDRIKTGDFRVTEIYESLLDSDESLIILTSAADLRKINGWSDCEASAIEVQLKPSFRERKAMKEVTREVGGIVSASSLDEENGLGALSAAERFPQFFDWLDLIDYNVVAILILMTVVAGFNMVSGLLILLFRNISTIGTLKTLGMRDRDIGGVFLRIGARISLKGMLIGNGAALIFCLFQSLTGFIRLDPANYFISTVPVSINPLQLLLTDAVAFVTIQLLLLIPSLFISKIDPSLTVKAE